MKIIDGHTHLKFGDKQDPVKAAKELLEKMDGAGIDKAVVMPDGMKCTSKAVEEACRIDPGRLTGFYMPDMKDRTFKAEHLAGIMKKGNFKGVKIHPRHQQLFIDDARLSELFAECSRKKIPVFIDCFPFGTLSERNYPLAFEKIAKDNPSLKLIMGHMGGYRALDAFIVAKSNRNIFLDVSFTFMYFRGSSVEGDVKYMLKSLGPSRFIYGSDYPYKEMKDSLAGFKALSKAIGLNKKDLSAILGGNMESVLK